MKPYIRTTDPGVVPINSDKEARKLLKQGYAVYGAENDNSNIATRVTKIGTKYITTVVDEQIYSEYINLYKLTNAID